MGNLLDIVSSLPIWAQYLIAILAVFALIWTPLPKLLIQLVRWPVYKLWPRREGWGASCIPTDPDKEVRIEHDPNRAWALGPGERWSHTRKMKVGDYYRLHIAKPRILSRIELLCKENSFPKKYRLEVRERDGLKWEDMGEYDSNNGELEKIEVEFKHPKRIVEMRFTITEPRLEPKGRFGEPAWSIFDVRLTEVRLFGKWRKKVIGR